MSAVEEGASLFDGDGESALLDARRLVRAGELASRANRDDDFEAFGALFRAIEGRLDLVARWVESGRREVLTLRASRPQEPRADPAAMGGA